MAERDQPAPPAVPSTLGAFIALVVVAGGNAPAIRYVSCGTCELEPFWGAAIRFLAATIIFAGITWARGAPRPRGRALLGGALFGVLQFGAGFGLIYSGWSARQPAWYRS